MPCARLSPGRPHLRNASACASRNVARGAAALLPAAQVRRDLVRCLPHGGEAVAQLAPGVPRDRQEDAGQDDGRTEEALGQRS